LNNEYIKIKNRIQSVYEVLEDRLPKGYCVPIKCFSTIYYMLDAVAKEMDLHYEEAKDIYNHYCDRLTKKTDYIDTKYYNPKEGVKHREECFMIDAFCGKPIYIACDNVKSHTKAEIAFLILHEIGHLVLKTQNERKCDLFARRWTQKLIKEGLI